MKHEDISLEEQIFKWEEWEDLGDGNLFFNDVELVVDIGSFKKGHQFDFAVFLIDSSIIEFLNEKTDLGDGDMYGHIKTISMGKYFCKLILEPYEKIVVEPVEE